MRKLSFRTVLLIYYGVLIFGISLQVIGLLVSE